MRRIVALLIFTSLIAGAQPARADEAVDLALVLAVDCSYSVDDAEFQFQLRGLADALTSPDVMASIKHGAHGRIAVTILEWASKDVQHVAISWTELATRAEIAGFAERLQGLKRIETGVTSISGAMRAGNGLLSAMPFAASRRVIDISTDGINNDGVRPEVARAESERLGIIVNGLAITREVGYLDLYFQHSVITGPGSFVIKADDEQGYHDAIKRKLLKEIAPPVS